MAPSKESFIEIDFQKIGNFPVEVFKNLYLEKECLNWSQQHCQNVTITAKVKCKQCERFFPQYHAQNCVISSSRPWPWVLGVSVAVSFVLLALFYVYKRQVSKKESSGEENFELLQYEIPNARTHFGPEGFFLAQDDSGDLLFDKNSEKGWMLDI